VGSLDRKIPADTPDNQAVRQLVVRSAWQIVEFYCLREWSAETDTAMRDIINIVKMIVRCACGRINENMLVRQFSGEVRDENYTIPECDLRIRGTLGERTNATS
jgi:hypothetical protein